MILKEKLNGISKYGLFGNIITPVANHNGTNDKLTTTQHTLAGATSFDITVITQRKVSDRWGMWGQYYATSGIGFFVDNITANIIFDGNGNKATKLLSPTPALLLPAKIRCVYNGAGATDADKFKLYINDIEYTGLTVTGTIPSSLPANTQPFAIDYYYYYSLDKIWYASISIDGASPSIYYFRGKGNYEYDLSPNVKHFTWGGTGARTTYDQEGTQRLATVGYSLWKKTGSPDIQVPYSLAGTPLSLTAGVNIETGYVKDSDVPGNDSYYNLATGLINFDPNGTADSKLNIFNKANSTIHIATGSMTYYDAAYPYRWLVSELKDYATYNAYFNAAYQDRLFTKVEGGLLKEILNCKAKQTGDDLLKAKNYCGII